jgi:ubiquinone/menaquinone biosynthesis C-methylase UbiE
MQAMAAAERQTRKDAGMEGWLARWYARTRHKDLAEFRQQAERVARRLGGGPADILEVAPGPGYFATELAKLGKYCITGLDLSRSFVAMATANAGAAGLSIAFRQGNAAAMPFADASFDFIYCSAAFKNFAKPVTALDEMHRVLRPGGTALVVDLARDTPRGVIDDYIRHSGRSKIDAWITRQTFRHLLLGRAYTMAAFDEMAQESRFGACRITRESIGLEVELTRAWSN